MMIRDRIERLFAERGASEYGGEAVTQLEHALQCAHLAEKSQSSPALIVAALLHDIGHLLHELPDDAPDTGIDDVHEELGGQFLRSHFAAEVYQPVELHVAAKRYLCTVDDAYRDRLSEPSLVSLELQGGTMSETELQAFREHTHWEDAVLLRRWDDTAKVAKLETPPLSHFLPLIEQLEVASETPSSR